MAGKLTLSVAQLNEYVRRMLQMDPMLTRIDVCGEISNLKIYQSGMLFFTLKDEQASIACMMSEEATANLQAEPYEGMRAVVTGSVGLYARAGRYQFYVNALHPQGVGVLYERLIELKNRLGREGLFDQERKRPLPAYPRTIGVVSSATGAVIHDIINVSTRRDHTIRILLCPSRVQGVGAAREVACAIKTLEVMDEVDVIIVARGGGSMEDLFAFNEECVVRAVAACKKPVISAVGHETDVTLCDLAADLRAPTPSAAAECAVAERSRTTERLNALSASLRILMKRRLEQERSRLRFCREQLALVHPASRAVRERERLHAARKRLTEAICACLFSRRSLLTMKERELQLLSPYGALSRGYAMVLHHGGVIDRANQLSVGDEAEIRFLDGSVLAKVTRERSGADGCQKEEKL